MHKTCKIVGRDGKGNGRAWREKVVAKALADYLNGKDREAWCFAYRLCRDAGEAGELLQEACYRVLRSSGSYRARTPVKSWLFTILRNAFMDSRRSKWRRAVLSLDWEVKSKFEGEMAGESHFLHEEFIESGETVTQRLEREETAALVRVALARLGRMDRQVLRLCDLQRLPYAAVARKLGIPEGTVRSRLLRARAKLRRAAVRLDLH